MNEKKLETICDSRRNVIVEGMMAVGKTTNLGFSFVDKIISKGNNLVILDSREEYLNKFYTKLKGAMYEIFILNFNDFYKSEGWNLLSYPYQLYKSNELDKAINFLERIAEEVFFDNANEDSFWMNSAREFFIGCCLALFEDGEKDEINLNSIFAFLEEIENNSNYVEEYFRTKEKEDLAYVYASGTVFSPIETRGGIISTVKQRLAPIMGKNGLMKLLNKSTFSISNRLEKKLAIFIVNSEEDNSLSPLTSIFIQELYGQISKNRLKKEFDFILDNFDTINYISNLRGILSACISKNIKFYLITRDMKLLETKYSSYIKKLANHIFVTSKKINITKEDEFFEIENEEKYDNTENLNDILYPSIPLDEIKVFHLKKFILTNFRSSNN